MYEETLFQKATCGTPMVDLLKKNKIIPGIKVDLGVRPLYVMFECEAREFQTYRFNTTNNTNGVKLYTLMLRNTKLALRARTQVRNSQRDGDTGYYRTCGEMSKVLQTRSTIQQVESCTSY